MNKDKLEERQKLLTTELLNNKQQLDQLLANIHALEGALQDIDYWLSELEKVEGKPTNEVVE